MPRSRSAWSVAFVASTTFVACRSDPAPSPGPDAGAFNTGPASNATVVHVTDGDTVILDISGVETIVRLIGIDTPETKKPDTPIQCFGPEASTYLADLLPVGTEVRVERDLEPRDVYGRLLGYLFLDDGTFVNEAIMAGGYARVLTFEPNVAYRERLVAAATQAEANGLGLWSACSDG